MPERTDDTDPDAGLDTDEAIQHSPDGAEAGDDEPALPSDVVAEAERLTRLSREAVDDGAARAYRADRDEMLAAHEFTARVRADEGESGETLVLHPEEWVEDDVVRPARIDDVDRAVETSLSGAGDPENWEAIDEHNRELVERVREEHGAPHAETVRALADFASNHYAKPIEDLSAAELEEFTTEYVTRNAWLSDEARAVLDESVRYAFAVAKERVPDW